MTIQNENFGEKLAILEYQNPVHTHVKFDLVFEHR